jgi:hypothetical protein
VQRTANEISILLVQNVQFTVNEETYQVCAQRSGSWRFGAPPGHGNENDDDDEGIHFQ